MEFKDNNIYQEEIIRERARLDEVERRNKIKEEKESQQSTKKAKQALVLHVIVWSAVLLMLWHSLKPLFELGF